MGEHGSREIDPDILNRTGAPILFVRIGDDPDVAEAAGQPVKLFRGQVAICFLLRLGREITTQPAEVRSVGIARIIRFRVMNPVRNHIALLANRNRVGPQENTRAPDAAELESLMRAEAVKPNRVVNGSHETGDQQDGTDSSDGKMRGQEPDKDSEGDQVMKQIERWDQARPIFPKTDGIQQLNKNLPSGGRLRRRAGMPVGRFVQDRLSISGMCVLVQQPPMDTNLHEWEGGSSAPSLDANNI